MRAHRAGQRILPRHRDRLEDLLFGAVQVYIGSILVDVDVQPSVAITISIAMDFNLVSTVQFAGKVGVGKVRPIVFIETLCSGHLLFRYFHNQNDTAWVVGILHDLYGLHRDGEHFITESEKAPVSYRNVLDSSR